MEKKLSAMQELIEWCHDSIINVGYYDPEEISVFKDVKAKATELLAKEKEQIVDAFNDGWVKRREFSHGNDYYSLTYK